MLNLNIKSKIRNSNLKGSKQPKSRTTPCNSGNGLIPIKFNIKSANHRNRMKFIRKVESSVPSPMINVPLWNSQRNGFIFRFISLSALTNRRQTNTRHLQPQKWNKSKWNVGWFIEFFFFLILLLIDQRPAIGLTGRGPSGECPPADKDRRCTFHFRTHSHKNIRPADSGDSGPTHDDDDRIS